MTIMAPEATAESLDPRDPLLRLQTFFDDGSVELLHERDRSGVLAAAGTVNRSEERRVGKECSEPCRSRWSPYH